MSRPLSRDTSPAAEAVQIDILRRLSPGRKIVLAADASDATRLAAMAGLRQRLGNLPVLLLERHLKGLLLGEELAARIWGPLPPS